jgi:hypothetical protein
MIYLVALYCLQTPPVNVYLREPRKIEAPACMEYKEEYAGTYEECLTRGVVAHASRLRRLYEPPIVMQGTYCRRTK